jgi:2-dehydropantoate 2-reductase
VTLLGRARLVNAVTAHGLRLQWPDGRQQTVHPQVIENLAQLDHLSDFELVLITVKSFDTATAASGLSGSLSPGARLLSLQNGVGNEEALAAIVPGQPIIAGSITLPVMVPQTGLIVVSKDKGGIGLAPFSEGVSIADVGQCLRDVGFTVATYPDHRSLKWSKLILNLIANASSAILDMPPTQSLNHPEIFDLEIDVLQETLAVMRAQGIKVVPLFGYPLPLLAFALRWLPRAVLRRLLKPVMVGGRGDKLPSLQLDLRQGCNESEVTVLNGVVAITGERIGVPVPVNKALNDILTGIVTGEIPWTEYKGNPQALWQQIYRG